MDLLLHMLERGQGYLHAVITYEATVIEFNKKYAATLRSKFGDDVVLIYPRHVSFPASFLTRKPVSPPTGMEVLLQCTSCGQADLLLLPPQETFQNPLRVLSMHVRA